MQLRQELRLLVSYTEISSNHLREKVSPQVANFPVEKAEHQPT
jgi:hypothetical protein